MLDPTAYGTSDVQNAFTSECFALVGFTDSAASQRCAALLRSSLLRRLVSVADLCLLGVLWWTYAYLLFSFLEGVRSFITRRLKICLGYVDSFLLSRLNKSMNSQTDVLKKS